MPKESCMSSSAFMGWRWILWIWMCALTAGFLEAADSVISNQAQVSLGENSLATLGTAEQVHLLSRSAAARGHPAIIRGVVTCSLPYSGAVVIQDATRGIYVDQFNLALGDMPPVGELIEVE